MFFYFCAAVGKVWVKRSSYYSIGNLTNTSPHPLFLPKSRNSLPYSAKIILYSSPRGRYNKAIISEGGMYQ